MGKRHSGRCEAEMGSKTLLGSKRTAEARMLERGLLVVGGVYFQRVVFLDRLAALTGAVK